MSLSCRPNRRATNAARPRLEHLEVRETPANYLVTTAADNTLFNPADFVFNGISYTGSGSLRACILQANASGGVRDTINFNIPAVQGGTIFLATPLPALTDNAGVVINASTQSGATPTRPVVVLSGEVMTPDLPFFQSVLTGSGNNNHIGFSIASSNNVIRGFIINSFTAPIVIDPDLGVSTGGGPEARNNRIVGNWIGLDSSGTRADVDAQFISQQQIAGVLIQNGASNNIIGGTAANGADRNVISGTPQIRPNFFIIGFDGFRVPPSASGRGSGPGIRIQGQFTSGNVVIGNFIGTNAANTAGVGNYHGIEIFNGSVNNRIGGTTQAEQNVIRFNLHDGIRISPSPVAMVAFSQPPINPPISIAYYDPTSGVSGGSDPDPNSRFAGQSNFSDGEMTRIEQLPSFVSGSPGNNTITRQPLTQNAREGGTGLGISLLDTSLGGIVSGVSGNILNDADQLGPGDDRDTGSNHRQNYPLIQLAFVRQPGTVSILAGLFSIPNRNYRIDFYINRTRSNFTGGEIFLGSVLRRTDGQGNAQVDGNTQGDATFSTVGLGLPSDVTGLFITATATFIGDGPNAPAGIPADPLVPGSQFGNPPSNGSGTAAPGGTSQFSVAQQIIAPTGIVSGTVFNDANSNGVRDGGEGGVGGVTVTLIPGSGPNLTTTTDNNGSYSFSALPPGSYRVSVTPPAGRPVTTPNPSGPITVTDGPAPPVNFGVGPQTVNTIGQVAGVVFNDQNGNGVQDGSEAGLSGVTVQLVAGGSVVATTTTATGGTYSFNGVAPGNYQVQVVLGSGQRATTPNPASVSVSATSPLPPVNFGVLVLGPLPEPPGQLYAVGADAGAPPIVNVYNTDGTIRFVLTPFPSIFNGGVRVATGDVNGDGTLDIITAAGPGGGPQVAVFDGVSGALIASFFPFNPALTSGVFVGAGDIDRDGRAEIIVGAGAGGGPAVSVFKLTGTGVGEMGSFFAYNPLFSGGVVVASADTNGDGFDEIVTGAGPGGGPHVQVFNGIGGIPIFSFFAFDPVSALGVNVAGGDVNGDGADDVIVGAGTGGGPRVRAFSGRDLSSLQDFFAFDLVVAGPSIFSAPGTSTLSLGGVRVGTVDLDRDGVFEVVTGLGPGSASNVRVYRGTSIVQQVNAFNPAFLGGVYVG